MKALRIIPLLLLVIGCATSVMDAQPTEPPQPTKEQPKEEPKQDPKAEPKDPPKDQPGEEGRKPFGPDELFTPLPSDVLHEGAVPSQTFKAIVLRAPMPGGADNVEEDLPEWMRAQAVTLTMMLEQELDYRPWIYTAAPDQNPRRLRRYHARLRTGEVPRPGKTIEPGAQFATVDAIAHAFGAVYAFVVSYRLEAPEQPALAALTRYRTGAGVESFIEIPMQHPDAEQPARAVSALLAGVRAAMPVLPASESEEVAEAMPVPQLVTRDDSMAPLSRMMRSVRAGELNSAWVAWEEFRKREPACGRPALYAMEMFSGLASLQGTPELNEQMGARAISVAREALKHAPNDVVLRGNLAWTSFISFARKEFALGLLQQALVVQPCHPQSLSWHALIEHYWSADRIEQAKWIRQQAGGKLKDGRIELMLGHLYFGVQRFEEGVEWYQKGLELAPGEYELHFSLALCANYAAEQIIRLARPGESRDKADELHDLAASSMWKALTLDPLEVDYAYDFYLRAITRNFSQLPTRLEDLDRMFLAWAARDGLASSSRTGRLDRLVVDLIRQVRLQQRKAAREANPGDEHFVMHLMARLHFAAADDNKDEIIAALSLMKQQGIRPEVYHGYMAIYGPLVK